jgi:hypothetical protein
MPQRKLSYKRQIGGTATEVSYDDASKGRVYTFLPRGDISNPKYRYTVILDNKLTNYSGKKMFNYLGQWTEEKPYITEESNAGQAALDELAEDATQETKQAALAEAVKNFYEKEDLKNQEAEAAKEAEKTAKEAELVTKESAIFDALTFEEDDLVPVEGNLELDKNYYFKQKDGNIYYGTLVSTSWGNYTFQPFYDKEKQKIETVSDSILRGNVYKPKNKTSTGGKNRTKKNRTKKNRTKKNKTKKNKTKKNRTRRGTKKNRRYK